MPLAAITETSEFESIFFASSALVPFKRTITGTFKPNSPTACTTPRATLSQRTIPPKILIRMDLTFLSAKIILKPFFKDCFYFAALVVFEGGLKNKPFLNDSEEFSTLGVVEGGLLIYTYQSQRDRHKSRVDGEGGRK